MLTIACFSVVGLLLGLVVYK